MATRIKKKKLATIGKKTLVLSPAKGSTILRKLSTVNSAKFCSGPGIFLTWRVEIKAKSIKMPVTTQVVTNVFVIGNGPMWPIVSAASDTPSMCLN